MIVGQTDPQWPKLLSLAAHELRSPLTVVGGYIRMLLKDRAGPLTDQQRRMMEEAEKSCGRLSTLVAEVSELAHLESGRVAFNRSAVDLRAVLGDAISNLAELPDRTVAVELVAEDGAAGAMSGDAARLRVAFAAIVNALRRELVNADRLIVKLDTRADNGAPVARVAIGGPSRVDQIAALGPADVATFDEWRGGNGLALPTARRIIESHGGRLWSPTDDSKAGALVSIPTTS
jgi:signal transduction histidine kinase